MSFFLKITDYKLLNGIMYSMSNILALCVADREKQIEKCSISQHCNSV